MIYEKTMLNTTRLSTDSNNESKITCKYNKYKQILLQTKTKPKKKNVKWSHFQL